MNRRQMFSAGLGALCALGIAAPAGAMGATPVLSEVAGSPFSTGVGSNDFGVAFSSTGLIATSDFGTNSVSLFNANSGAATQPAGSPFAAGPQPWGIAFSPNGGLLAAVDEGGASVSVYDASSSGLVPVTGSPFSGTGNFPDAIAFSSDDSLVATSSSDDGQAQVGLFTVGSTGALKAVTGSPFGSVAGASSGIAFSPHSHLLAVAGYAPPASDVVLYRASARGLRQLGAPYSTGSNAGASGVAFSPNGRLLAVMNNNNSTISLYHVSLGRLTPVAGSPFSTGVGINATSLSFSPNGKYLAVANSSSFMSASGDDILVYTVSSTGLSPAPGSPFSTSPINAGPQAVAFSPDGKFLASADITGYMSLFTVSG